MARPGSTLSRRLPLVLAVLGLFVLLDLVLFGWLLFRSLSEREINEMIRETREEGENLVRSIEERAVRESGDLYTVIALEPKFESYLDSLIERGIVSSVKVLDETGGIVYSSSSQAEEVMLLPPPEVAERVGSPEQVEGRPPDAADAEVPHSSIYLDIADLGHLELVISQARLEGEVEALRRALFRQAATLGAVTLLLLLFGFLAIWGLLRRSRRLEEQAAEAERLAYIGTLASGLAHEIRNPLNSLNLNMQMLAEELAETGTELPAGGRLLGITRSEIHRLERLVTDFLSYARPRPLELEEVPAVEFLRQVEEIVGAEVERRGARLEIEGGADDAVRVDLERMKQLLMNLVQNALAATEGTGRPPLVTLASRRRGSRVVLEVRDNGAGIAEEDLARVFELFYSTRKGGTGLGLSVVDRIARAHGGRVEIDSEPERGTTVSIYLPAAEAEPAEAGAAVESSGSRGYPASA